MFQHPRDNVNGPHVCTLPIRTPIFMNENKKEEDIYYNYIGLCVENEDTSLMSIANIVGNTYVIT